MFKVNDVVVYGSQGVCEIIRIEDQRIGGETKKYFVLKPKSDKGATFYVPTWNEKALAKMRKVMTKQDVDTLIDSMPNKKPDKYAEKWKDIYLPMVKASPYLNEHCDETLFYKHYQIHRKTGDTYVIQKLR